MIGHIYITTNIIDGKQYIGQIPWNKGLKTGKGQKEFRKVTIL